MALAQPLEGIICQWVMETVQVKWDMDPPDGRNVLEKEQVRENKSGERDGFAGVQESILLYPANEH